MNKTLRTLIGALCVLSVLVLFSVGCDEEPRPKVVAKTEPTAEQQRIVELQQQVVVEQAQRVKAEQEAAANAQSIKSWVAGLTGGAVVLCVIVGLIGIHVGTRARIRAKGDPPHEH